MIRQLLFCACIGGLFMGNIYEAPKEQQAKQDKWSTDLGSSNKEKREMAEGQLYQLARSKAISNRAEAEAIYKQILASNPNCEPAHVRLAEIYLGRWNGKTNSPDLDLGLQHLRRAIELANQDIQSYSDKTPFLKLGAIDHAKKLSQIEQQVNQGVTGLGLDFPQY